MSSVIKDLYLHRKMVESSRGLNSLSDDFMNSSFWHSRVPWFRGISDNPNPALKRLTISFLALEGKVRSRSRCIRRQRFTRIVKAPKRISCHLELGNINFHVPIMCKPMYAGRHKIKLWRCCLYFLRVSD